MQPKLYKTRPSIKNVQTLDVLTSALTELYFIEHPEIPKGRHDPKALRAFVTTHTERGVWAHYPWRKMLVHLPSEELYVRLRTARNRNLILPDEQKQYRDAVVGIAGLSVGSAVLSTLVLTGGPKHIKIADPDSIEITNLNRLRGTLLDVGQNKTRVAAHNAWEVDPFLIIETWEQGISRETLSQFTKAPKLSVFVDEMDAIELKFAAREVCKKNRVPVVMATDNGDSIILDVERFDLEPNRPIFHGRVSFSSKDMRSMTREKFVAMANEIIDPAFFTLRQQASIMEIGKSLSGVAQLGTAATLGGVAVAFAVRQIVTGKTLPSGRYVLGCEEVLVPGYNAAEQKRKRAAHTKKFKTAFTRA